MCGAADQDIWDLTDVPPGMDGVIQGRAIRGGVPVPGAFVRLLDAEGEFTAEVVASPAGRFRFYARPGAWTLRALAPGATGRAVVHAAPGEVTTADIDLT